MNLGRGFGWSIYLMLGMIFTLAGIFAWVVWKNADAPRSTQNPVSSIQSENKPPGL